MDIIAINSRVEIISNNIDELKLNEVCGDKQIAIYGLDTFSYVIQSLMLNRKLSTDCYVSFDSELVVANRRRIKAFSSRFLKNIDDAVKIYMFEEIDSKNTILLTASQMTDEEENSIKSAGYVEGENYFHLYDWTKDEFAEYTAAKKAISLKELHEIEKNILKGFDQFCRENNLRYWVCGGTLLGAVRHKGFIPWDDDIDVFMPWEDYRRLCEIYDENEYELVTLEKVSDRERYTDVFAKLVEKNTIIREAFPLFEKYHPAWIDIFPIIGMPDSKEEQLGIMAEMDETNKLFSEYFYRNNGNIRKRNEAYSNIVDLSCRYKFENSEFVGVLATQYREKDIYPRTIFAETIRVPFEDIEVNIPGGYDKYLLSLYGANWMEIPDESIRNSGHDLEAFWV